MSCMPGCCCTCHPLQPEHRIQPSSRYVLGKHAPPLTARVGGHPCISPSTGVCRSLHCRQDDMCSCQLLQSDICGVRQKHNARAAVFGQHGDSDLHVLTSQCFLGHPVCRQGEYWRLSKALIRKLQEHNARGGSAGAAWRCAPAGAVRAGAAPGGGGEQGPRAAARLGLHRGAGGCCRASARLCRWRTAHGKCLLPAVTCSDVDPSPKSLSL